MGNVAQSRKKVWPWVIGSLALAVGSLAAGHYTYGATRGVFIIIFFAALIALLLLEFRYVKRRKVQDIDERIAILKHGGDGADMERAVGWGKVLFWFLFLGGIGLGDLFVELRNISPSDRWSALLTTSLMALATIAGVVLLTIHRTRKSRLELLGALERNRSSAAKYILLSGLAAAFAGAMVNSFLDSHSDKSAGAVGVLVGGFLIGIAIAVVILKSFPSISSKRS